MVKSKLALALLSQYYTPALNGVTHVLCVGCRLGEMRLMAGRIRNMRQQLRDALAREGEYEQEREVHWKQYAMPLWPDVLCLQCSIRLDH